MKKITVVLSLILAFLCFTSQAQLVNAGQLSFTNTGTCPVKICMQWGVDCQGDGIPDSPEPDICIDLLPGASGSLMPSYNVSPPCVMVSSYTISILGQSNPTLPLNMVPGLSYQDPNGNWVQESPTISPLPIGDEYGCLSGLTFNPVITDDGTRFEIGPKVLCGPFCFKNETDCFLSINISGRGDRTCTPQLEDDLDEQFFVPLEAGKTVCITLGSPDCPICPKIEDLKMGILVGQISGGQTFGVDPLTGADLIDLTKANCGGGFAKVVLENGVYVIRKL